MTILATLPPRSEVHDEGQAGSRQGTAWVDDHHRHHHRGEGINVTTPGTDQAPTLAAA
jgi:hypothetical protein